MARETPKGRGPADVTRTEAPALIAILDDHHLFSASLGAALQAEGYAVVAPALTGSSAAAATRELAVRPPLVALLDLDLGLSGKGEDLLPELVLLGIRVLIVSGTDDEPAIGRCLQAGAWGFVPKTAPFEKLLGAVHLAADGRPVVRDAERDRLLRVWRQRRDAEAGALAPFTALSRREAAVLVMLQQGRSVGLIAQESYVSEATVRSQVRAILTKLGVRSQLQAVALANQVGWSPVD